MIRPAERFSVNMAREAPALARPSQSLRPSPMALVVLAAALGIGAGGLAPTGWLTAPEHQHAALAPAVTERGLAAIEPAAGPPAALVLQRAPDAAFYTPVTLDGVPVTVRLVADAPGSALTVADARRLSPAATLPSVSEIAELRLGAARLGPVVLPTDRGGATVSVLGADVLDRLGTVAVEGQRLTLTPR
jgi:hypothetical protein